MKLPKEAILTPDHFVHFEKRYKMATKKGALLKCSFGSFDRPEHKLIIVQENDTFYYPQPPVMTATNNNAHKTIGEYIHG
jgi:tRNA (guanine-N7-)-methyltransferase